MRESLIHLATPWSTFYADSAMTRTFVAFAHIGGLIVGAGRAILTDTMMLAAWRRGVDAKNVALVVLAESHRTVLAGLAVVIVSGLMLVAANLDTYLVSSFFWTKMFVAALLCTNGAFMRVAAHAAGRGLPRAWTTLRTTAVLSVALWALTTLLGAALPNAV